MKKALPVNPAKKKKRKKSTPLTKAMKKFRKIKRMKPVTKKKAAPKALPKLPPKTQQTLEELTAARRLNPANEPLTLSIPLDKNIIFDEEFLWFANSFAKGFRTLQPYAYKSREGKYQLKYFESWEAEYPGQKIAGVARVAHSNGCIQCSKEALADPGFTENFVFFLMLWSRAAFINGTYNTLASDRTALSYYLLTGRSKKEIIKGLYHMGSHGAPLDLTLNRLKQAEQMMKK